MFSSLALASITTVPLPSSASCSTCGQSTDVVFPLPVRPSTWRWVVRSRSREGTAAGTSAGQVLELLRGEPDEEHPGRARVDLLEEVDFAVGADSDDADQRFRSMSISDSGPSRSPRGVTTPGLFVLA